MGCIGIGTDAANQRVVLRAMRYHLTMSKAQQVNHFMCVCLCVCD